MKIILDCMGSDLGVSATVGGAVEAVRTHGVEVMLVGDSAAIREVLTKENFPRDGLTILDAQDVITMEDDPVYAVRNKKSASMIVALQALADGEGDAIVSAGNTGALLTAATLILKRFPGTRRGALCAVLPSGDSRAILIDCGANVECTSEMLVQFAHMGSAFVAGVMGVESPRVGLINNGTEYKKGTPLQVETYQLLKAAGEAGQLNFIGNVEGREVPGGGADVFVADGFTGNVVLKTYEGAGLLFARLFKELLMSNTRTKLAALSIKRELGEMKKRMDYKEIGGAPILGVRKPVIKAHGSSDAHAFASAIDQAKKFFESGAIHNMETALGALNSGKPAEKEVQCK